MCFANHRFSTFFSLFNLVKLSGKISELKVLTIQLRNNVVKKILFDGYGFLRSKEKSNSTYWVCDRAKLYNCRAKLTTFAHTETYKVTSDVHTHVRNMGILRRV
jgi:hypothetical protein